MKKVIAIVAVAVLAVGCDGYTDGDPVNLQHGTVDGDLDRVKIDGMDCIVWNAQGYVGGLTCDWEGKG